MSGDLFCGILVGENNAPDAARVFCENSLTHARLDSESSVEPNNQYAAPVPDEFHYCLHRDITCEDLLGVSQWSNRLPNPICTTPVMTPSDPTRTRSQVILIDVRKHANSLKLYYTMLYYTVQC
jgi:hypothetical protein